MEVGCCVTRMDSCRMRSDDTRACVIEKAID